jgi:hypothetical protein
VSFLSRNSMEKGFVQCRAFDTPLNWIERHPGHGF